MEELEVSRIPMSLESEEIVLGTALSSHDGLILLDELTADDFYAPQHKVMFEALSYCREHYHAADPVSVADVLTARNALDQVGGMVGIITLIAGNIGVSSMTAHIQILQNKTILRRLLAESTKTVEAVATSVDAEQLLADVEARMSGIQPGATNAVVDLRTVIGSTLDELERDSDSAAAVTTGLTKLDEILNGLKPSTLTIVGARPSIGKTAFALGIALHAAKTIPVALFSLEMSRTELGRRVISSESRIKAQRLSHHSADDMPKFSKAVSTLAELPIYVDDSPVMTVSRIKASARRIKQKHGLGLVIIDYIQLITPSKRAENRQVEVSEMSRQLKLLARELDVPVIALSQLSRALEQRADKRPTLADLRESGSLEQDADNVLFLYRDLTSPVNAEVIVAKHRNGPIGSAKVGFIPDFAKFFNMGR